MEYSLPAFKSLHLRHSTDNIVLSIAKKFLLIQDFKESINFALAQMGEFLKGERADFFLFKKDSILEDIVYQWCSEKISSEQCFLKNVKIHDLEWFMNKLNEGELICYKNIDEIPEQAQKEREILRENNVKSILIFPAIIFNKLVGFVSIIYINRWAGWSEDDISLINMVCELITLSYARNTMEEDLRKANYQLSTTLKELKETQERLIEREKLAAIGQLAAGIAHEINNPLGFILSNFETVKDYFSKYKCILESYKKLKDWAMVNPNLLEEIKNIEELEQKNNLDFIDEDWQELFADCSDGIERIRKIVKGMKLFSYKNEDSSYGKYDLNQGIQNTLTIAYNEIKYYAKIDLRLADIPLIDGVTSQLNQVLLNLILNAAQAIQMKEKKETGLIKISTLLDKDFVICNIEDNGIGIKEENISKIFNPFFTTKPIGQGTGLGLSISYDIIVNKHHGEITTVSSWGLGTIFTIKLPVKQPYSNQVDNSNG